MPTDAHLPTAGSLSAEIRAAIEAMTRRTGYLGPTFHQLERWAAEAARLEASHTDKHEIFAESGITTTIIQENNEE